MVLMETLSNKERPNSGAICKPIVSNWSIEFSHIFLLFGGKTCSHFVQNPTNKNDTIFKTNENFNFDVIP